MLVGGRLVVDGSKSASAAFVAFNVLLQMLVMPLRMLGMWIGQAQRATASGERVFQVLDEVAGGRRAPPTRCRSRQGRGTVRFEGVTFAYAEGEPVLRATSTSRSRRTDGRPRRPHGLGQDDPRRARAAVLRPAGGARHPSTASTSATSRSPTCVAPIGVVAQDPFLFSASVRENIAFGAPEATIDDVVRAAQAAQAHEFVQRLPDGYDTVIGERGVTLSGGQRQRLAIARALCTDPRILVLDDSTASVDASTEARIREGLAGVMEGRTTLVIAHRLSTIALADEIVVVDGGRIVAHGTHDELRRASPIYREIVEHGLLERQIVDEVLDAADEGDGTDAVTEEAAA